MNNNPIILPDLDNIDPSRMSQEEKNAMLVQLYELKQMRANRNLQNTLEEIHTGELTEESKKATGIDSGLTSFVAGVGKSFVDTGRAAQQLGAYTKSKFTGDEKPLDKLKQEQADANFEFSRAAGGYGTAGEITGLIGQSLIPGTVAARGIKGAVGMGALTGAAQPLTPESSFWGNVGMGAAFGAGAHTLLAGAGKLKKVKQIASDYNPLKSKTGWGDQLVREHVTNLKSSMTPAESAAFDDFSSKILKEGATKRLTPGEALGSESVMGAERSRFGQLQEGNAKKLEGISNQQKLEDLNLVHKMALEVPELAGIRNMDAKAIFDTYGYKVGQKAQLDAAPYYERMRQTIVPQNITKNLLFSPDSKNVIQKAINDPYLPIDVKSKLVSLTKPKQGADSSTIILPTRKIDLAASEASQDLSKAMSYADWNEVYKTINRRVLNKGDQAKAREVFTSNLGANTDFTQAISIYKNAYEGLEAFKKSPLYRTISKKPDILFNTKKPGLAMDTAQELGQTNPELLNTMIQGKTLETLKNLGSASTNAEVRNVSKTLSLLEVMNTNRNPVITDVIKSMKQYITAPRHTQLVGKTAQSSASGQGTSTLLGYLNPVTLLAKLKTSRGEAAFVELVSDPNKWVPLLRQNITPTTRFDEVLDMIMAHVGQRAPTAAAATGMEVRQ